MEENKKLAIDLRRENQIELLRSANELRDGDLLEDIKENIKQVKKYISRIDHDLDLDNHLSSDSKKPHSINRIFDLQDNLRYLADLTSRISVKTNDHITDFRGSIRMLDIIRRDGDPK